MPRDAPVSKRSTNKSSPRLRQCLLTYSQVPEEVTREHVLEVVKRELKDKLQKAVVAVERHQDGGKHIHVALKFRQHVVRHDVFDLPDPVGSGKIHPNIQPVDSWKGAVKYVFKEDESPLIFGEVAKPGEEKPAQAVAADIMAGLDMPAMWRKHREYMLRHARQVQECMHLEVQARLAEQKVQWTVPEVDWAAFGQLAQPVPGPAPPPGVPPEWSWDTRTASGLIVAWLANNIQVPRKHKQAQLWIHAPPNVGKSYLSLMLDEHLRIYRPAQGDSWYHNLYRDGLYDLVVMDEFSGRFCTPTDLNQFVEGTPLTLKTKGGQVLKNQNLPVIVLSNYTPAQCWSAPGVSASVSGVEARFIVLSACAGDRVSLLKWPEPSPPLDTMQES